MKTIGIGRTGCAAALFIVFGSPCANGDLWLGLTPSGTNVALVWTNPVAWLETSPTLTGQWAVVSTPQIPHVLAATNPAGFFRLRLPGDGPFDYRYLAPRFTARLGDPANNCGCTSPEGFNRLAADGDPQDNATGNVLLHTGELTQHATDMSVLGRGMDWKFERRYRSGMDYDGPLGHGWDFNYNRRLVVEANGDVLRIDGLGRTDRYVRTGDGYEAPRGFYTRLARRADQSYEERDRHGTIHFYASPNSLGVARLRRIRDRQGNQMALDYNPVGQLTNVTDTLGRRVAYSYNPEGRLSTVTDFTGRIVQLAYDAAGNLRSVTSPAVTGTPHGNDFPLGKTVRYDYTSGFSDERLNHNLSSVTAPNEVANGGPPRLVVRYEENPASTNIDRVQGLTLGGTNSSGVAAGGTIAYAYQDLGPAAPGDFNSAVLVLTVTNRNANVAQYSFNQSGKIVREVRFTRGFHPGEPPGYTNLFELNLDGEITRHVLPEGNSVQYTYDRSNPDRFQQGNLLEALRLPGPRGASQTQLLTTYTYEPLFNQARSITDPRGNDPAFVPPNGGPNSPARYTHYFFYDYQEAPAAPPEAAAWGIVVPPALLNQGDLNDDSSVSQARGNLVRRASPTVHLLPGSNQAVAEGTVLQQVVTRFTYDLFGQVTRVEDARGNIGLFGYFPETDPDGDGLDLTPGRDPATGGYLAWTVRDAVAGPRRLDPLPVTAITNRFARDPRGNVTRKENGRGDATLLTWNELGQVVRQELPKVDPSQATGYLQFIFYDANDNRTGVDIQNATTDPLTHLPVVVSSHPFFQHRFVFDILDEVLSEFRDATRPPGIPASPEPERLETRYRYDPNSNPVRVYSPRAADGTDPDNYLIVTFDERDLRHTVTRGGASPQASTWTFDYDANRNLVRWTDAQDNDTVPGPESELTRFDGYDRRVAVADRAGGESRFAYDPSCRIVAEEFHGRATADSTTNTLLKRMLFSFDEMGRQIQADQALFLPSGVSPQIAAGLVEGPLTPGDGYLTERQEFDALGRLTYWVSDNGAVYSYQYDGAGRRVMGTLPLVDNISPGGPHASRIEYAFDPNDNPVRRTETHCQPEGLVPPVTLTTHFVYDALNRLIRLTDPLGQTHYTEYDAQDNAVARFDARGPLLADPLGLYTAGNINDRGNATRCFYDGLGRMWKEEHALTVTGQGGGALDLGNPFNPDGLAVVLREHDANSRIARRTDDRTNRVHYAYDALNRMTAQTNADYGIRTWDYDADHNPLHLRDENNTLHTFAHDALGRQTAHSLAPDPARTNSAGLPLLVGTTLQTFEYDGLSRLVRCADNNEPADPADDWTVEARFDSLGRLVEEIQNGRAVASGYTSIDRTELHYPQGNRVIHYGYDSHHQCIAVSNATSVSVGFALAGFVCPPAVVRSFALSNLPPSLVVTQGLNANRRISEILAASPTVGPVSSLSLARDRAEHVASLTRIARNHLGQTTVENLFFGLDSLSRQAEFASQLFSPTLATNYQRRFLIDGAQDVREIRDQFNQPVFQAGYSPTHEIQGGLLVHNGSPGTGIRTRDAAFIYQWDGLNRLRTVRERAVPANVVATYRYDACPAIHGGRRVQKTSRAPGPPGGTVTTRYYYHTSSCIEETDVGAGEKPVRQFLFGTRPDEVLAMDADTDGDGQLDHLWFYLRDHNNNVVQLVDASGQPAEFYFYDFRGRPLIFDAPALSVVPRSPRGNPWLFTGQRYDSDTGLYYCKARDYDPVYGVFLSRDPLGFWHDPYNLGNPMAFVGNSPWNRRDPTGLCRREGESLNDCVGRKMGETALASATFGALSTICVIPAISVPCTIIAGAIQASFLAAALGDCSVPCEPKPTPPTGESVEDLERNIKALQDMINDRLRLQDSDCLLDNAWGWVSDPWGSKIQSETARVQQRLDELRKKLDEARARERAAKK